MRFSLHTAPHSILSKYFQAHCIRTRVMTMNNFHATIQDQCFLKPIEPTPSESLKLSIIDRVPGLRHMVRSLHVFKHGENPTKVIKDALAKALVMYHPFAGRFVDPDEGELEVTLNCNGEGAWFVEAEANCSLEDVKYLDHPLLISRDELLPCPHEGVDPLNIPVTMQVTEFTCGGFVAGIISIHTIADGLGAAQFINAIGDIARGQPRPNVNPTWSRHLIPAPKLPLGPPPIFPSFKLQYTTFDLPIDYINQTKISYFEAAGHHCSTFDISIAKAWQARTHAIDFDPETLVHVCFFANARHLLAPQIEEGYYGNCFYPVTVTARSRDVVDAEIVDVVRLIRDAKARLPKEFARWANGEFKEDPYELTFSYNSLFVSDWTRLGFLDVDYGWGKPVHVLPFAYYDFMAVVIFGAPPAPKKGVRVMTQCVEKEHLLSFQERMKRLN